MVVKAKFKLYLFFFSILPATILAQQKLFSTDQKISDSLFVELNKTQNDLSKAKTLLEIGELYMNADPTSAFIYTRQAEMLAEKVGSRKELAKAYYIIGNCYDVLQSYSDALEYYYKALPIIEEEDDKQSLVRIFNHIGVIYGYQKEYKNSLKYFLKFTVIAEELKDSSLEANGYNNIGLTYNYLGNRNVASEYFYKALKIFTAQKRQKGIAVSYSNISSILADDQQFAAAIDYSNKALAIFRRTNDQFGLVASYQGIAELNVKLGDTKRAFVYFDSALVLGLKVDDKFHLRDIYEGRYKLYSSQKDFPKAFENLLKFMNLRDSTFGADNISRSAGLESKYKMEQNEKEIELLKTKEEISSLQNTQNRTWIGLLVAGISLVFLLGLFVLNRYRHKQKANVMLEKHNVEVEHQKKEITDSITYAKRIQMSILPPDSLVEKLLPDSFVLYKPKDIVSGDFYWVEECDGKSLFAAVDCTGHGVPGAMMSVVGFNLLSAAVNEKGLSKPSLILEHLDVGVDKMLRQSSDVNSVRDGMDLSLCCLDSKTGILQYAGAYNPIWIMKNGAKELMEIKADKMMIGVNAGGEADHFTNHEVQLQKGDVVYIFSDGYADQFGGPKGKKLKYKPMMKFLVEISILPMGEQRRKLDQNFEDWRGSLEQVDDILVIGVRF